MRVMYNPHVQQVGLVRGVNPHKKKAHAFRDLDVGARVFIQPEWFVQMEWLIYPLHQQDTNHSA